MSNDATCVSLCSSAGIGELGLVAAGFRVLAASELLGDRCALYRHNYPDTTMFQGDLWETGPELVGSTLERSEGEETLLVYATPPCQGMSTNGIGKLRAEVAAGNRGVVDKRNLLVIPIMDAIVALRPKWLVMENVPGMLRTVIPTDRGVENIVDYITRRLGSDYLGRAEVLSCANYGIPQLRKRLLTVFTRTQPGRQYFREHGGTFFPVSGRTDKVMTLRDAIGHLPSLDAVADGNSRFDFHPLHVVNVMKPEKYEWVMHTPENETAFNNQCVNTTCQFGGNARHVDLQTNGRWASCKTTPIECQACGSALPRPTMRDPVTGSRRLISGFHSSYRRMPWDEPARTITRNFPFEASDNKIHPEQNRVLSAYEATVIQTIDDYEYSWSPGGKMVNKSLMARVIGESVPPKLIEMIARKITAVEAQTLPPSGQLMFQGWS